MKIEQLEAMFPVAMLPPRQLLIFHLIVECIVDYGHAPTCRELGALSGGRAVNAISQTLDALERKGFITRVHQSRGIQVVGLTATYAGPLGGSYSPAILPPAG
jgi:SOS-response transcriptional repressor LexA